MTQARGVTFARLVASTRRPSPKLATFVLPTCFVIEPQHLAQRGTQFERDGGNVKIRGTAGPRGKRVFWRLGTN